MTGMPQLLLFIFNPSRQSSGFLDKVSSYLPARHLFLMAHLCMLKAKPLKTAGSESRERAFIRPWHKGDAQLLNESIAPSGVLEWLLVLYSFLEGSIMYF